MAASSTARAYQEAAARLRRRHDDEFHAILKEVYEEWGLQVEKRRSRKQAALARFEEAKRVIDAS